MKLLFVCTDNIGRSVTAEYCLKDYLAKQNIASIEVSSAGTDADSDLTGYSMAHFDELRRLGIDTTKHKRTQITKEIADGADLVIAMAANHQQYMLDKFGAKAPLYNEILKNEPTSIVCSALGSINLDANMRTLVHYINDSIPILVKNLEKRI
jgi:protein-tyrosine-phosphatase